MKSLRNVMQSGAAKANRKRSRNPPANAQDLAPAPASASGTGSSTAGLGHQQHDALHMQRRKVESLEKAGLTMEEESVALRQELRETKRRVVVLEEKMEQLLDLVGGAAFRSVLEREEKDMNNSRTTTAANTIRGFVSLKKHRFQEDGFDLDLSYIGAPAAGSQSAPKRLIAMGIPSLGIEAVYRNPFNEVVRFFSRYHHGNFRIYNLCAEPRRQYDPAKFQAEGGSVVTYPFLDHNACALAMFRPFCEDVAAFLAADPQNVAAIHCKAGKGRTGTFLCAFLVHAGICVSAAEAMEMYGWARTRNGKGVTIPSQRRFVEYYERVLRADRAADAAEDAGTDASGATGTPLRATALRLTNLTILNSMPNFTRGGCAPFFHILAMDNSVQGELMFDSTEHAEALRATPADAPYDVAFHSSSASASTTTTLDTSSDVSAGAVPIMAGTIKIQLYHQPGARELHEEDGGGADGSDGGGAGAGGSASSGGGGKRSSIAGMMGLTSPLQGKKGAKKKKPVKMCHFWLHTAFMPLESTDAGVDGDRVAAGTRGRLVLQRHEIDGAHNGDAFDDSFAIELKYELVNDTVAKRNGIDLAAPMYGFDAAAADFQVNRCRRYLAGIGAPACMPPGDGHSPSTSPSPSPSLGHHASSSSAQILAMRTNAGGISVGAAGGYESYDDDEEEMMSMTERAAEDEHGNAPFNLADLTVSSGGNAGDAEGGSASQHTAAMI